MLREPGEGLSYTFGEHSSTAVKTKEKEEETNTKHHKTVNKNYLIIINII